MSQSLLPSSKLTFSEKIRRINKDKVRRFLFGNREKKGFLNLLIIYALLLCIGFIYLYPLLYMISNSMMTLDDLLDTSTNWIPSSFYLKNYTTAAASMDYWNSFWKTVVIAGLPTIINVVVCAVVGYGFARFNFRGKKFMLGLLIFSFIMPPVITMMPTYLLYLDYKIQGTLWAFILPAITGQGINAQIYILIFYQFFKMVPNVLLEAAKIDGAGHYKAFMKISLPSAAPALLTVFLFSLVWYWNEAYLTQLYVAGVKSSSVWTTLVIQLKKFDTNYSQALSMAVEGVSMSNNESIRMAATMLSILPILLMYFILQRYFVESIDRTGITGE